MAKTLDDIFEDDDFGLLNAKEKVNAIKTDEDRLIDSFEEINTFYEKNNREPAAGSMSEYGLMARLKGFRSDDYKKRVLKPFDRFDLLGHVEMEKKTLDDIFQEDDAGLLTPEGDNSIFQFKYLANQDKRADADFVAQRKPMKEEEFQKYEILFQQVHQELKEGKRKLLPFRTIEKSLHAGNYYLLDGVIVFLELADLKQQLRGSNTGNKVQLDGRTVTIYENATTSNLTYRSLGKALQKGGKLITNTDAYVEGQLIRNTNLVSEEDIETGWIYVLQSKSTNPKISSIENLFKIGFTTTPVSERIKNAAQKPTYLFAEVEIVATYHCYSLNTRAAENLIHRFFAECCLNIDLYDSNGQRAVPREWFVVPLAIVDEAIELLQSGEIVNYEYDIKEEEIVFRN